MSEEVALDRSVAGARGKPPAPGSDDTVHKEHHRNVAGGLARAAVFGVSDGLLTNVSLILGVAGASPAPGLIRLAGIAGMVAGAFSMGAGEFISVSAQSELLQREIEIERLEIERHPEIERRELAQIYERRGIRKDVADTVATALMADPAVALQAHAREELGIDPSDVGAPLGVALSSFISFAVGAAVPLFPWLFFSGTLAVVLSVVLAVALAATIGVVLASFTGRSRFRSMTRQVGVAVVAAAVTYGVGRLVGVGVQ